MPDAVLLSLPLFVLAADAAVGAKNDGVLLTPEEDDPLFEDAAAPEAAPAPEALSVFDRGDPADNEFEGEDF